MSHQDQLPFLLNDDIAFPSADFTLSNPEGLLAVGGDLSTDRLINAYRHGIFPWYSEPDPILWWCPSPRAVIYPETLHISKSLAKLLRQKKYRIELNRDFESVIANCAERGGDSEGTWITSEMYHAYCKLAERDVAHCVAIYHEQELIGGLYGLSMGKFFFGESMFSLKPNASKVALVALAAYLFEAGFLMIDCQIPNPHLTRMGAVEIAKPDYLKLLQQWVDWPQPEGLWLPRELTDSLALERLLA
jgi:leucyl/phenylalanyl-tRNA---protein transferase